MRKGEKEDNVENKILRLHNVDSFLINKILFL